MLKFALTTSTLLFFLSSGLCQAGIIRNNNIREKKIYYHLFDQQQKDSLSYLVCLIKFNTRGYPVEETAYKKDGDVLYRSESKYDRDTIEKKRTRYGSGNKLSRKIVFKYDADNHFIAEEIEDRDPDRTYTIKNELDSAGRLLKRFFVIPEGKFLMTNKEYDDKGRPMKVSQYKKGELDYTTLNEFDSAGNIIRASSLKGEAKEVHHEKKYNSINLLVEDRHAIYVNYRFVIYGIERKYKIGDEQITRYTYDTRGLLTEETEYLNGKLVTKLKYEYSN